jgi:hypothetical protein
MQYKGQTGYGTLLPALVLGFPALNVLATCLDDRSFAHVMIAAPGSSHDATLITETNLLDLVPEGHFLLCDGGGGLSRKLLTPYDGVRYHLKDYRGAGARPSTPKEVFNHL